MDKGLKKINELREQIKELQESKKGNDGKISNIIKSYKMLMLDISLFEENNSNLTTEKTKCLEAPQKRKKEKNNLITNIIFAYLVTTLISFLVVFIGSGGTIPILSCILPSLAIFAPVCGITIPLEFKSINKKYPIVDITKIENEILANNINLESAHSKKNELENLLNNIREINENYAEKINILQKEIDAIAKIRNSVIEDFCKNNIELDKKIDSAYSLKEKLK